MYAALNLRETIDNQNLVNHSTKNSTANAEFLENIPVESLDAIKQEYKDKDLLTFDKVVFKLHTLSLSLSSTLFCLHLNHSLSLSLSRLCFSLLRISIYFPEFPDFLTSIIIFPKSMFLDFFSHLRTHSHTLLYTSFRKKNTQVFEKKKRVIF